ncbi:MBL fold metallo-hydrolase [Oceanobacillus saliphilus]|uniref:MBL fold metallo-hydrolase n=1 Tax=Oceanobacillus saliphilus TaxID=2925834 RepID=UPI00201D339D|nr:MBL fold metallo-hydrolase [Oceanobacillus saliphilus]
MTDTIRVIPIECKFGKTSAYAYYIDAPEPALIDTGIHSSAEDAIEPVLKEYGIQIEDMKWILLTHGHVDHLGGARAVWEKTGRKAKVVIPKKEAELLRNKNKHLDDYDQLQGKYVDASYQEMHKNILMNDIGEGIEPADEVSDGDTISLGGDVSLTVVETAGHSAGMVSFILNGLEWAFAADAVQMYGGAQGGFPTIEQPALYRKSLNRLFEEIKPKRLFLGHHFLDNNGNASQAQLDGEEVVKALKLSLDMDKKLAAVFKRHLYEGKIEDREGTYGRFTSIAEELEYKGNPNHLPCAFFVTMNGYEEEYIGF